MITTRLPIPVARPCNRALTMTARQVPSYQFNLFNEDDVVFKASKIPWEAFHLSKDNSATADTSQSKLSEDLAELARFTIIGRKPQRQWPARPKHGVIGDHLVGQETSWPPRLVPVSKKIEAPGTETNQHAGIPVFAPKPIVPLGLVRAGFEVQATAGPFVETELTPLSATFPDENVLLAVATQNGSDVNENAPNAMEGPGIPAPRDRSNRQPLGLMHCDEEATPPSNRIATFVESPSSAISEWGSDVSSGSGNAKDWVWLRPRVPAIKIWGDVSDGACGWRTCGILKSAGVTRTSNASMMGVVPPPSVNTLDEVTGGNY